LKLKSLEKLGKWERMKVDDGDTLEFDLHPDIDAEVKKLCSPITVDLMMPQR